MKTISAASENSSQEQYLRNTDSEIHKLCRRVRIPYIKLLTKTWTGWKFKLSIQMHNYPLMLFWHMLIFYTPHENLTLFLLINLLFSHELFKYCVRLTYSQWRGRRFWNHMTSLLSIKTKIFFFYSIVYPTIIGVLIFFSY